MLELSNPAYCRQTAIPNWNRKISAKTVSCSKTASKLLLRFLPGLDHAGHVSAMEYHIARSRKLNRAWVLVYERATLRLLGRQSRFEDYRVAAVGNDCFPEETKRVLRHCAYRGTEHANLAEAHRLAAESLKRRHSSFTVPA